MTETRCPVCKSNHVVLIESILSKELADLYLEAIEIDVSPHFSSTGEVTFVHCTACDLRFFSPPCPGDAQFYEQLQQINWYYQDDKPEYAFAKNAIASTDSVLEVGCGKGAFRSFLPGTVRYKGLEFNDEAVRKAQTMGLDVDKQSIQEHVSTLDELYDVVCTFQVLEHVSEPAGFIKGCVSALKPSGKLIVAVPAEDSFLSIAANSYLNMPPHHVLRWSDLALSNLAKHEDLTLETLWHEPVASFHRQWHASILARYYFSFCGLHKWRIVDRTLSGKVISRLLKQRSIRDFCAARISRRFPVFRHGHTVVMIASARQHNHNIPPYPQCPS